MGFYSEVQRVVDLLQGNYEIEFAAIARINDFATEPKELSLDMDAYFRFLVELLQDAGALKHPGSVVDDQGPRFTSTVSLLFADKPEHVIDKALKNLKQMLFRV